MSIVLDLPQDLEAKLSAEASRAGLPLPQYVLAILSRGEQAIQNVESGLDLLGYWQQNNVIGTRPDISDSESHARNLRSEAEERDRS